MPGNRKKPTPSTEAALWALSNGRCYAPGCPFPVIVEIRPGVYQKNVQIAHIHGVSRPRFKPGMTREQCAMFSNLLLLCLAHHGGVDDPETGEQYYPADLLRQWKTDHEGANGPALATLGMFDEDSLADVLETVFTPPIERLERIADQLEETGTLNAQTVMELRQIIDVMISEPSGLDARTASMIADASVVFGTHQFQQAAKALADASVIVPGYSKDLDSKISRLQDIAVLLDTISKRMGGYM